MDYEQLKKAAEEITMPEDMKRRIVKNCKTQISNSRKENYMRKNTIFRKPVAIAATLAICLSLTVTTVLATTGVLQGFFKDVKRWDGAVVGTTYKQATDEVNIDVTVNGNELTVLATFINPQSAPYCYAEQLGIAEYKIIDTNGQTAKEGVAKSCEVVNGQAAISIGLDDIANGSYKLVVTAFVSEKKADQPLPLNGHWECDFTK